METQDMKELAENANAAAKMLKAMSHSSRLMILCSLMDQELPVKELNELVPITQSSLSQHLAILRNADLVSTRREAQTIYYKVKGKSALSVIMTLKSIYCP